MCELTDELVGWNMISTYLKSPQDDSGEEISLSRQPIQVHPKETEAGGCKCEMKVDKDLIEGMANGRKRVQHEHHESDSTLSKKKSITSRRI